METTLSAQSQGFLYACVLGFALGLFFDVFRVLRVFLRCERRPVFFQDLLCFSVAAVATFLLALGVNYGEVRFFLLAGEGIGVCVYFLTVGEITVRLAGLIFRAVRAVWLFFRNRIFRPVLRLFVRLGKWIFKKLPRMKKIDKNIGEIEKTT